MPDGCSRRDGGRSRCRRSLEAAEPPEARGLRRDEVRLLVSRRRQRLDRAAPRSATCRAGSRRRSARRQHQRHAERRADGTYRRRAANLRAASVDAAARRFLDRRGAAPGTSRVAARARCARGDDVRLAGRRPRDAARAVPAGRIRWIAQSRLWMAALQLPEPVSAVSGAIRLSDSLRLRDEARGRSRCIRRCSRPSLAARRCRRRRGRSRRSS